MESVGSITLGELCDRRVQKELVFFDETTTTTEALRTLSEQHIHSAPVIVHGVVQGFVDVRDIVASLISDLSKGHSEKDCLLWPGLFKMKDSVEVALKFSTKRVSEIVNKSKIDSLNMFTRETTLAQAVTDICGLRLHRVLVKNGPRAVDSRVLSVSDIVGHLASTSAVWKEKVAAVTALDLIREQVRSGEAPLTIAETDAAVCGFNLMLKNQVSGVGVVDAEGRVVANFAASDICSMMDGSSSSLSSLPELLSLPIHAFLLKQTAKRVLRAPIVVSTDTPLERIVQKAALFRAYRVWVADTDGLPVGIVTPFAMLSRIFL